MILRGVVFSQVLEMDTGITVVTGMPQQGHPYKVIYLLHGLCGSNSNWVDNTMLPVYAAEYNTIFIMPDSTRSFYTDMVHGQKYFSYITEELPEICSNIFNISSKRQDTAIMGNSMGGYGALKAALRFPEKYSYCAAFSPGCLFLKDFLAQMRDREKLPTIMAAYGERFVKDFICVFGENFTYDADNELLELAHKLQDRPEKPKLYVACGTRDYLHGFNVKFREEMKSIKLDFTFEQWPGEHDWYFFNQALKKGLEFQQKI